MLDELERDRLDQWRWQSFVGEEAALECLYTEAPDTASKRCLSKVCAVHSCRAGGGRGWQQQEGGFARWRASKLRSEGSPMSLPISMLY